jgi:LysR family glycine cleavage system transcriptional activator
VRLRVSSGAPSTDFASNDADVVIQWADDFVPGVRTEPLIQSTRFPVISPDLLRREKLAAPSDLLRMTLMHDEVLDGWAEWFAAAGLDVPEMPLGPVFPNCELATTAAEQGQGVSLAYSAVVGGTLATGRLVRLFDAITMPNVIYSVAYSEWHADDPMIREFCNWIFDEVAGDGSGLTNEKARVRLPDSITG